VKILAVETCTDACSAAILDGEECRELFELAPRRHTALILPMVDSLLSQAGLVAKGIDAVAFSRGPGAFTGVRIGTAVAQGIALGADIPLIPISTLAALALRASNRCEAEYVSAALDARMGQVYVGLFRRRGNAVTGVCAERVGAPGRILDGPLAEWVAIGSGWDCHGKAMTAATPGRLVRHLVNEHPHAADVARLGAVSFDATGGVPVEEAVPVYLRDLVVGPR